MSFAPTRMMVAPPRERGYEKFVARLAQQSFAELGLEHSGDVPDHSGSRGRRAALQPGHLFAHRATAAFDVEWVVIALEQRVRGRALVVAADAQTICGPGDLLIPGGEPCGALTVRCAIGLKVPAMAFARAPFTGQLPAWCLRRAKALHHKTEGFVRRGETLDDPNYWEHMDRIEEARRSLASWCQAFGDVESAKRHSARDELGFTIDDRIGQLYDEIGRLTELEDHSSSPAFRKAWAELRRLQHEEARRDREAFEASLAMPVDAGRRILERARASRERFEDLAACHRASG